MVLRGTKFKEKKLVELLCVQFTDYRPVSEDMFQFTIHSGKKLFKVMNKNSGFICMEYAQR